MASDEKKNLFTIKVLGTRGSMPTSVKETSQFGGSTSCYLVETNTRYIILDAGSGIMNVPYLEGKEISVFITHPHIDHLLGIPFFLGNQRSNKITFYGHERMGLSLEQQIDRFMSEPLWPCTVRDFAATVEFKPLDDWTEFHLGEVTVSTIPSNHPGGSTIIGLECGGKKLIYATDFEHSTEADFRLRQFAEKADLLMYDAQYMDDEYDRFKGYGHSTIEKAIAMKRASNAKKMLLIHHAPTRVDDVLSNIEKELSENPATCDISFAREGRIYELS